MKQYLIFQLYAPLASWGDEAGGEMRRSATIPTRSALLGLLAAAVGIRRDEEQRLESFNHAYHLAVRPRSGRESWLEDYHTTQVPPVNRKRRYYTRREELDRPASDLGTILSQREYRCDGYWQVAVSCDGQPEFSLEALQQALMQPCFPLYLGRKSCPLALPLKPELKNSTLREIFYGADLLQPPAELELISGARGPCYWDDPAEDSLPKQSEQQCYHQPLSRARWQFASYLRFSGQPAEEQ